MANARADTTNDPDAAPTHLFLGFLPGGTWRHHVAVCSCGWVSQAHGSAGLAGSALDRHRDHEGGD